MRTIASAAAGLLAVSVPFVVADRVSCTQDTDLVPETVIYSVSFPVK